MIKTPHIRSLVSGLSFVIAFVIAVAIPAAYCGLGIADSADVLDFKARLSADRAARFIFEHDRLWQYQMIRLAELIAFPEGTKAPVRQRITDLDGTVVVQEGRTLQWPVQSAHVPIVIGNKTIGWLDAEVSLRPLLISTAYIGAVSFLLGCWAWLAVRLLAVRALDQTLSRLAMESVRFQAALDNMGQGLCLFDANNQLIVFNRRFATMFGTPALGSTHAELSRDQDLAAIFRPPDPERPDTQDSDPYELADGRVIRISRQTVDQGGWVATYEDITERSHAREQLARVTAALRDSEAGLDRAQEIAGIGSWELELATGEFIWSKQMYRLRGMSQGSFEPSLGNMTAYVHAEDRPQLLSWITDLTLGVQRSAHDLRMFQRDGEIRILRVEGRPVLDADGMVRRVAGTMQDVTERRQFEQQLAHAQKMEAIGNLTGGMAHDFNNVLGVIIGNLDLLQRLIKDRPAAMELCDEALQGASRCADLIRRLLAFAQRQSLRPELTDVNARISDISKILTRLLGERIPQTLHLEPGLWPVMVDPIQLEAALVNLATNARDAMPDGGTLDIMTSNTHLDDQYVALHAEVIPGDYVMIAVTDSGMGIPPDIMDRIFEPFFTTKEPGKGTGLGLAMIFGFLKQSGSHVAVQSALGKGTTFRIYLPRAREKEMVTNIPATSAGTPMGRERVLVVEDKPALRRTAALMLSTLGYQVQAVDNADQALAALDADGDLELLFTDIIMPGPMDGVALAKEATRRHPGLKVLLTSGFVRTRDSEQELLESAFQVLRKPYQYIDLARAVRVVLDQKETEDALGFTPN